MQNDQALYGQAVEYYQSGNLSEAERILRQILTNNPKHAPSLHVMGIIGLDVQNYEIAEALVREAVALQDNNPNFHLTLGRILGRQEKKEDAIKSYRKALSLRPDFTDALNNLSTMLLSTGKSDEALKIFAKILKKNPQDFNALSNTASILYQNKKYEESITHYRAALAVNPVNANIYFDLGRAFQEQNKTDEALSNFLKAVELKPNYIDALLQSGNIYRDKGNLHKALLCYRKIKEIEPNEYAYVGIASIYLQEGDQQKALDEAESAYKNLPESPRLLNFMAHIYDKKARYQEALEYYDRAIEIDPTIGEFYANKATTLKHLGRLRESIEATKKGFSITPKSWIYSNLLLTMVYADFISPEEFAQTSFEFGKDITDHLVRNRPFTNEKDPDRRLRIGYVSADFRTHSVSSFLSTVYYRDKGNFEIFAFSKTETEDHVTDKLRQYFDHWRDVKYMKPDEIADLIEEDKIDILVDLAGHTAHNGLMIFARKPAPIQLTWMGYPATTGMKAMDYRITDNYAEPPGMTEHLNTETLWRLPDIFVAYTPQDDSIVPIDHPPFVDNGHITFGCFNNFTKVTDKVLQTWAKVLDQVPNSKLLLEIAGIKDEAIRANIEERIVKSGITLDRLILEPQKKANQYVLYNKIDIALDPFPCVGGTTSMDTLWMGVPLITLEGQQFLSRMGVTILTNVGLTELIAQTTDEYISVAVALANDKERLHEMRHNLRERFVASPAMDQKKFVRNMENAYREMWHKWVEAD